MAHRIALLLLAVVRSGAAQTRPTAREIIDQIKSQVGVQWRSETVDTIKAGSPDTPVTGIATTMMATYEVLKRAAAQGRNLVITHEPTFYSHVDLTDGLQKENDPVWAEKDKFIREHNMVVFRFHDHWHMRQPDGVVEGITNVLGWRKFQTSLRPPLYGIPETTVANLASELRRKLNINVMRVVGSKDMKVTRLGFSPGASGAMSHRRMLQRDDVEVLIVGEVPEWETIEYVADAAAEGKRKALILLGHIPSEQAGMENCAEWLKAFIKGVPIAFVPASEPFWAPSHD